MKNVVVLGSTGSIGTQTLDVIAQHPDLLRVVGLAAHSNEKLLREQAEIFGVSQLALFTAPQNSDLHPGIPGLCHLATLPQADLIVVSVAGVIGLQPTFQAIQAGKSIALASKEVLVAAGEIVMPLIKKHGVLLTPIDSEHSAIFQCLKGYRSDQIEELIITASGGPFRGFKKENLKDISVAQALNHPTWRMGGKITIDSATLMNKALEMIEARWLFDVPMGRVKAVIHPQSVIHSMVKFKDGSVLGQLGWPNMRLPILYALLYPERVASGLAPWNPVDTPNLTFESVDEKTFSSLHLARQAMAAGGTMPSIFNAANEEVTNAFLRGDVKFLDIFELVERVMAGSAAESATLDSILAADAQARQFTRNLMKQ